MTPEQWLQVKQVLASALEQEPAGRAAYLDRICTEPTLRREVESLIAANEHAANTRTAMTAGADVDTQVILASLYPSAGIDRSPDLNEKIVGRFVIRGKLGAGGMGEVYRAEDTKLKRTVALKRIAPHLRSERHFRERLLREAVCASRLNEPHVAGIYDIVEDGDEVFLVMEYIDGQTLRQRLAQPLGTEEFLPIATQCAEGLSAAHKQNVVHGDIKPENVMLTPAGQVKILDFGIARVLLRETQTTTDNPHTQTRLMCGTPGYMSPEVLLEKPLDGRSDIFSLGVTFYEALSGRHPFVCDSFVATCQRILEEVPPALSRTNPAIPVEVDRIVAKMMAKKVNERYESAAGLLVDLRQFIHPRSGTFVAAPVPEPWPKRRQVLIGIGIIVLLVSLFIIVRPRLNGSRIAPIPHDKLVAVLPFTVASGDSRVTPFTDGLTETLTAKLTQLTGDPTLQVVPAPDIRTRHVSTVDEAHREFGATMAMAGSLYRSGDQVRFNIALVDTRSHRQLRAESLTMTASDAFAVQDQIVNAAVHMLGLQVESRERDALNAHGTLVATAYDFYLQGRGYLQNYDKVENVDNAIKVFDTALQLDPRYALAYAGRGEAYWKMYERSKDPRWVESSRRDCERAVSLDAGLPAAHLCLGAVHKGTGHYPQAIAEFARIIEAEPTDADAYRELAEAYEQLGKGAEAEATYRRAIELRPQYWAGYNWLGVFYYHRGEYKQAADMFEQVAALAPDNARGLYNLGASYVGLGRYAEAIAILKRAIAIRPEGSAFTNLGNAYFYQRQYAEATRAYAQAIKFSPADALLWWNLGDGYYWTPGNRSQANDAYQRAISFAKARLQVNETDAYTFGILAICQAMVGEQMPAVQSLRKALELTPNDPELRFKAALIYNQLGDIPQALSWLEKGLSAGFSRTIIQDTPDFDHLRSDPRFQEILRVK